MISYAEAVAAIAGLAPSTRDERVPIHDAQGRILAEDVRLAGDQPPFDRSTMDGYAVVLGAGGDRFQVVATVAAGTTYAGELRPGQAVRIMTGAPCPGGATVVPIEATDGGEREVRVTDPRALTPRRNIAIRGEDGRAGATVLARGTRLGPVTVAVAAMAGLRALTVRARPRVAFVTTGDEVARSANGQDDVRGAGAPSAAESSESAEIADSNGPFLSAFCSAWGLPSVHAHAADDALSLRVALEDACAAADIVVTTGGVSAGDKDLVPPTASALGFTTVFHHVAMQPGKPVFLARRDGCVLVGLPGNPVSVVATAHLVLGPVIARLGGGASSAWRGLPLAMPWKHTGKRQLFLPARLVRDAGISADGGERIEPIRWNGSGDLIAAAAGDGLIDLAPGFEAQAGHVVRFLPYVGMAAGQWGLMPGRAPA